jgi:hypothetical protein
MNNLLYANSSLFYKSSANLYKELSQVLKCTIYGSKLDSEMLICNIGHIPSYSYTKFNSIKDMMEFSVQRLQKLYSPPYYLSWSGGVDSTAMVCAFLSICPKDIIICYTKESIEENPEFYLIIEKYAHKEIINYKDTLKVLENNCFCLGQYVPGMSVDIDTKLYINNRYIIRKEPDIKINEVIHSDISGIIDECPVELRNFWDLYYYLQLRFKSQVEQYISFQFCGDLSKYKHYEFFYNIEFLFYYFLEIRDEFSKGFYKSMLKKYIVDYTKNNNYYNLHKKNSRIFTRETRDKVLCITSDGRIIYNENNNYTSFNKLTPSDRFKKLIDLNIFN